MLLQDLPEVAIVRVLTPGGPYAVGDMLSVAYLAPTIGRLVAHDAPAPTQTIESPGFVPETISVCVSHAAPPYARDAILTLSFLDPHIARIHPTGEAVRNLRPRSGDEDDGLANHVTAQARQGSATSVRAILREPDDVWNARRPTSERPDAPSVDGDRSDADPDATASTDGAVTGHVGASPSDAAHAVPRLSATSWRTVDRGSIDSAAFAGAVSLTAPPAPAGVRVRLQWNRDRVRRFVQVIDKLFTIDRLGWYRHTFAMRLLVPDEITCGDATADVEAMRHLVALRAAAVETLGRPLLAAFMPNFSISAEWLESLDNPVAARALAGLREAIVPFVCDDTVVPQVDVASDTTGVIERGELERQPASTVESALPIFIASHACDVVLTERLEAYRQTLVEVFGQTARSAEAVRLNAMSQPNHALDDRLWQLVGTVGQSLGGLAVA